MNIDYTDLELNLKMNKARVNYDLLALKQKPFINRAKIRKLSEINDLLAYMLNEVRKIKGGY